MCGTFARKNARTSPLGSIMPGLLLPDTFGKQKYSQTTLLQLGFEMGSVQQWQARSCLRFQIPPLARAEDRLAGRHSRHDPQSEILPRWGVHS